MTEDPVAPAWRPVVTVVVPMFNERGAIEECLEGFEAQTWPLELLDVVVVDGRSDDGSREAVEALAETRPWLRLIDNPKRRIPAACNLGVEAAKGEVVCFFSSHGVPSATYAEQVVAVLADTGAAGVGGVYDHEGTSPASRSIGLAMASPFGMASPHRYATDRREVDTISHPAYRIEAVTEAGGFDEEMQRNEDYELNWRIREAGGRLVFDPTIASIYRPRPSLKALARQFFWYGTFKARMLAEHPESVKARHVVPPLAMASLVPLVLGLGHRPVRRAALAAGLAYGGLVLVAVRKAQAEHPGEELDPVVLAAAFPVMHGSWGAGFLASVTGVEPS